jgi:2-polyprenyl-3-methyl-5-hydroxy-6-metoxy-1,4-benzoquinol methylase
MSYFKRLVGKLKPVKAQATLEPPIFPRISRIKALLPSGGSPCCEPAGGAELTRVRMLEAKVEYLLDEIYRMKSLVRYLLPQSDIVQKLKEYQLKTFDYQWKHLPYHLEFPINPAWRDKAADDVSRRLGVPKEWFGGKKILDAGCGPGRHSWAFATLGAQVTAFDMSDNGLEAARRECASVSNVVIEKRNILEALPYDTDYDLVWSYGVMHHTGDPYRALTNIARHVKPGGHLYFMVYTEPKRDNIFEYAYYHEISRIRDAIRHLSFEDKARIVERLDGPDRAQQWFDAISSEVNELFTVEELTSLLMGLGFVDIKRTMPEEAMHNMVGRRPGLL